MVTRWMGWDLTSYEEHKNQSWTASQWYILDMGCDITECSPLLWGGARGWYYDRITLQQYIERKLDFTTKTVPYMSTPHRMPFGL